jgi:hypothetical protein
MGFDPTSFPEFTGVGTSSSSGEWGQRNSAFLSDDDDDDDDGRQFFDPLSLSRSSSDGGEGVAASGAREKAAVAAAALALLPPGERARQRWHKALRKIKAREQRRQRRLLTGGRFPCRHASCARPRAVFAATAACSVAAPASLAICAIAPEQPALTR